MLWVCLFQFDAPMVIICPGVFEQHTSNEYPPRFVSYSILTITGVVTVNTDCVFFHLGSHTCINVMLLQRTKINVILAYVLM